MKSDHRPGTPRNGGNLCDGNAGGIRSQDTTCRRMLVQFFKDGEFDLRILRGGLYNQVGLSHTLLYLLESSDVVQRSLFPFLRDKSLRRLPFEVLRDRSKRFFQLLGLSIYQAYNKPFLCEDMRDPITHGTGADHGDVGNRR